jgi:probable HAF family extracellular repeat protein
MKRQNSRQLLCTLLCVTSVIGNVFGQNQALEAIQNASPKASEVLEQALEQIQNKKVPQEIFLPSYFQWLHGLGEKSMPIGKKQKKNKDSMMLATLNSPVVPETSYFTTRIGDLDLLLTRVFAVNNNNEVVGYSIDQNIDTPRDGGFLFKNGVRYNLRPLGMIAAYDINNKGQIVGYMLTPDIYYHACLYENGVLHDLGTLGGTESVAYGINDAGQIVGYSTMANGEVRAFLYQNVTMTSIGHLGGNYSVARAINDDGDIVGYSRLSGNSTNRAFLYVNGIMHNIGTLGGSKSEAYDINNNGDVVGYSTISSGNGRSFLYKNGTMQNLGTLGGTASIAFGINNFGDIVGESLKSDGSSAAYVYQNGIMINLNTRTITTTSGGLHLTTGVAINDAGSVAGSLPYQSFFLAPLPEGSLQAIQVQPEKPNRQKEYPVKGSGKDSLVLITHGWTSKILNRTISPADPVWLNQSINLIEEHLFNNNLNNWQVFGYKWVNNSWTVSAPDALFNSKIEGLNLGSYLALQGWSHIHLIGHSAGAQLIEEASRWIKSVSPSTVVHCTFLDAYVGNNYAGVQDFGSVADWSDSYYSYDWITGEVTSQALDHAYNVNVTLLDPHKSQGIPEYHSLPGGGLESTPCYKTLSSHGWPYEFYANTIAGTVTSDYAGFGFPLSKEGGNWDYAINHYVRGNNPAQVIGTPDPVCTYPIHPSQFQYQIKSVDFPQIPTIPSPTGTIEKWNSSLKLKSGSPVWLASVVSITSPVNTVTFNAQFVSTNDARGLLTVYWDAQIVGSMDEALIGNIAQQGQFTFPRAEPGSVHVLGFRLDPFTNAQSTAVLTNIVLTQIGVSKPFSLTQTTNSVSGLRVWELVGEAGYTYSIESSTNLIDWTNKLQVVNTNGAVKFFDQSTTNGVQRFYRASSPQ